MFEDNPFCRGLSGWLWCLAGNVCMVIFLTAPPVARNDSRMQLTNPTAIPPPVFFFTVRSCFHRAVTVAKCLGGEGSPLRGFLAATKSALPFLNGRCIFRKLILCISPHLLVCRVSHPPVWAERERKSKKMRKKREKDKKSAVVCRSWSSFVYIPKSITPDSLLLYT